MAGMRENDLQALIERVDKIIASPSQRAYKVWTRLKEVGPGFSDWDLICFSIEFLGAQSHVYPWLEEPVKSISRLVYTAHYMAGQSEMVSDDERERDRDRKREGVADAEKLLQKPPADSQETPEE